MAGESQVSSPFGSTRGRRGGATHRPLCEKHSAVISVVPKPCVPASHPAREGPDISSASSERRGGSEGRGREDDAQPTMASLALHSSARTPAATATRSPLTATTLMSA